MIIDKITIGFVVQKFDTEKGKCVSQSFVASDDVTYEDENGQTLDSDDVEEEITQTYFPFDMVQP